uniref:Ras-GAP domain-containing protein n=1 Tax=Arcella intermedia TaxID=1963864 RepID=A0A6B2L3W0_9EUKA
MWSKARREYDLCKSRVDLSAKQQPLEPIRLFVNQSQFHIARLKEIEKYEIAADHLSAALWKVHSDVWKILVEFFMMLYDAIADQYSLLNKLDRKNLDELNAIVRKRNDYLIKTAKRDEERRRREKEAEENKYRPLVDLLSAKDFALLNAICVTAGKDQDTLLTSIVKILDAHGTIMSCIRACIVEEVAQTNNEATLFRGNSTATKLMSAYTKMIGHDYLKVIQGYVIDVLYDVEGYEIKNDPQNKEYKIKKLRTMCQRILDEIIGSFDMSSMAFREIAQCLVSEVRNKFPNSGKVAAAGFIFLRFFCPAVSAPETYGLIDEEVSPNVRKSLVLISKCLQNLANGQKLKEDYLVDMNVFIEENLEPLETFLMKWGQPTQPVTPGSLCTLEVANEVELPLIQELLVRDLEKIAQALINYKQEYIIEDLVTELGNLGDLPGTEKTPKKNFF